MQNTRLSLEQFAHRGRRWVWLNVGSTYPKPCFAYTLSLESFCYRVSLIKMPFIIFLG